MGEPTNGVSSSQDTITPTFDKPLKLPLDAEELRRINDYLTPLPAPTSLSWAITHLPNLYQTTAFGLTGLVTLDMLSQQTANPPPLVFFDTLYHFPETLELVEEVKKKYGRDVIIFKPQGCNTKEEFEEQNGEKLWEENEMLYDYLVKVEPSHRAYRTLDIKSVITGRRASQGGERSSLPILEVDSTGMLKLNPLLTWSFQDVQDYIKEHHVPYNKLLDQGYKSVGDWHSTVKAGEGGEREGRWKGKQKAECGLHVDYFKMKSKAEEAKKKMESGSGEVAHLSKQAGLQSEADAS